jgi:hypothetical protein
MAKLKLPRRLPAGFDVRASGLPVEVPVPVVTLLLGRREFLKAAGAVLAALSAPLVRVERAYARARGRFFTGQERATLEGLVDRILPPDADPGAKAMGAARYIEDFLTAFDGSGTPRIFAGGPFSGRTPYPDNRTGRPSGRRPRNAFRHFIALTPRQELRWRAELFGSARVPGADFNDAALGPLTGLRDVYRDGLARVDAAARSMGGATFNRLSTTDQDRVLTALDAGGLPTDPRRGGTFLDVVIQHTLEGCFAAPEYGGNLHLRGWRMVGIEGDDQPLGYSIFSRREDAYRERRRHPMSTPNPDELAADGTVRPRALSADSQAIEGTVARFTGALETC